MKMIPDSAQISSYSSHSCRQLYALNDFENREEIIRFLKSSHTLYEKVIIPEVEQNFLGLMKMLPNEPSITVIFNLFLKFQISFELHMKIEEQTIYLKEKTVSQNHAEGSHMHEEPFLTEIIMCLKRQKYAENPFCQTLINRLVSFNEELKNHAWIEEHLI